MQRGQTLIELILVIGLISILFPALLAGFFSTRSNKATRDQKQIATGYLNEAQEAIRIVRANGWSNLNSGTYHPLESSGTWVLSPGAQVLESFTRQIVIGDVKRDASGNISEIGEVDPSTKLISITVSWDTPFPNSVNTKSYLTRHEAVIRKDTNILDFSGSTANATISASPSGPSGDGQIELKTGGGGDWCAPSTSLVEELDLPKQGTATTLTAIAGQAMAGTGENSSGESLADVRLTDANPPSATIRGIMNGYKTNDVFNEANYGYIATDTNQKEIVIIDTSSLPFTESGYFNAPGNRSSESVYVSGNTGFALIDDKLYNFDLSSKTGSRPIIDTDGVVLSGNGTSVYVVGSYAYVAVSGNTNVQLDIVNLSNTSNLQKVGSAKVNNQSGIDVVVNPSGIRAYLVTNATTPIEREFHILDVTNKSNPLKIGQGYHTNGMNPEAVEIVPLGNRAVVVGTLAEEYQVVNISDENNPLRCGGSHINTGIYDSASVRESDFDAFTYIVTGDATLELKVLKGPGGYFPNGSYTSPIFDAGENVMLNSFSAVHQVPSGTSIEYFFAVADAVNGSCSGANFAYAGPFSNSASLPFSISDPNFKNPGRCIRYRIDLSTNDFTKSPIVEELNLNYSL